MPAALGLRAPLLAARQTAVRSSVQAKATRPAGTRTQRLQSRLIVRAEGEQKETGSDDELSEQELKQKEIDRLRAAEKFALIGSGKANCKGCGYVYDPRKGDSEYPISPGTQFEQLPEDWGCPTCGAPKNLFELDVREVAGFAENQGYGLGTNSMTEEGKSRLIYGSLLLFFFLFLSGYFLQ